MIIFKHTSEVKMFAFRNEKLQLLCCAIRAQGQDYLDDARVQRKVREILKAIPQRDFDAEINLPPAWLGDQLRKLYEN